MPRRSKRALASLKNLQLAIQRKRNGIGNPIDMLGDEFPPNWTFEDEIPPNGVFGDEAPPTEILGDDIPPNGTKSPASMDNTGSETFEKMEIKVESGLSTKFIISETDEVNSSSQLQCTRCGFEGVTLDEINSHIQSTHQPTIQETLSEDSTQLENSCSESESQVNTREYDSTKQIEDSSDKPFKCNFCSKSYVRSYNLKKHQVSCNSSSLNSTKHYSSQQEPEKNADLTRHTEEAQCPTQLGLNSQDRAKEGKRTSKSRPPPTNDTFEELEIKIESELSTRFIMSQTNLTTDADEFADSLKLNCTSCGFEGVNEDEIIFHTQTAHQPTNPAALSENTLEENSNFESEFQDQVNVAESTSTEDCREEPIVNSSDAGTTPYRCSLCSKTFRYRSTWRTHLQRLCTPFTKGSWRNDNFPETPFQCAICQKRFKTYFSLNVHGVVHVRAREDTEPTCETSSSTMACPRNAELENMEIEIEKGQGGLSNRIIISETMLKTEEINPLEDTELISQTQECAENLYIESDCQSNLGENELNQHVEIEQIVDSIDKPYKCSFCSKSYLYSSILKRHQVWCKSYLYDSTKNNSAELQEEKDVDLTRNSKSQQDQVDLNEHERADSGEDVMRNSNSRLDTLNPTGSAASGNPEIGEEPELPRHSLPISIVSIGNQNVKFRRLNVAQPPWKKVPTSTGVPKFKCKYCKFMGATMKDIFTHIQTTHQQPANEIILSGDEDSHTDSPNSETESSQIKKRKFMSTKDFDEEVEIMDDSDIDLPSHECSICSSSFYDSDSLSKHIEVYHLESAFGCEVCSRKFCKVQEWSSHVLRCRSSAKPLQCPVCPASFQLKSSLDRHKSKYHGGRKFKGGIGSPNKTSEELNPGYYVEGLLVGDLFRRGTVGRRHVSSWDQNALADCLPSITRKC